MTNIKLELIKNKQKINRIVNFMEFVSNIYKYVRLERKNYRERDEESSFNKLFVKANWRKRFCTKFNRFDCLNR